MRLRTKAGAVGGGTPFISEVGGGVLTDSNPSTWERADITGFTIPPGTNHIELMIYANENVFNNTTFPEFDAHFADNVSLSIYAVPEPGSLTLCALAASLGTVARLRRRQYARALDQQVLTSGPSDDRRRRRT